MRFFFFGEWVKTLLLFSVGGDFYGRYCRYWKPPWRSKYYCGLLHEVQTPLCCDFMARKCQARRWQPRVTINSTERHRHSCGSLSPGFERFHVSAHSYISTRSLKSMSPNRNVYASGPGMKHLAGNTSQLLGKRDRMCQENGYKVGGTVMREWWHLHGRDYANK